MSGISWLPPRWEHWRQSRHSSRSGIRSRSSSSAPSSPRPRHARDDARRAVRLVISETAYAGTRLSEGVIPVIEHVPGGREVRAYVKVGRADDATARGASRSGTPASSDGRPRRPPPSPLDVYEAYDSQVYAAEGRVAERDAFARAKDGVLDAIVELLEGYRGHKWDGMGWGVGANSNPAAGSRARR